MHAHLHTYMHTHTHTCINTYICTHSCINTYMHTQLHISHTCRLRKSQRRPFHAASFAPPIHMPAALAGLRAAAPPALHPLPPRTHPAGLCRRTSAVPKLHRCDLRFVFRQSWSCTLKSLLLAHCDCSRAPGLDQLCCKQFREGV